MKIKNLVKEIEQYAGTKRGDEAKMRYDIIKLETERKRNVISFINMIILAIIAITNLVLAILKYFNDK